MRCKFIGFVFPFPSPGLAVEVWPARAMSNQCTCHPTARLFPCQTLQLVMSFFFFLTFTLVLVWVLTAPCTLSVPTFVDLLLFFYFFHSPWRSALSTDFVSFSHACFTMFVQIIRLMSNAPCVLMQCFSALQVQTYTYASGDLKAKVGKILLRQEWGTWAKMDIFSMIDLHHKHLPEEASAQGVLETHEIQALVQAQPHYQARATSLCTGHTGIPQWLQLQPLSSPSPSSGYSQSRYTTASRRLVHISTPATS